ncbi:nucleic acid-binding protein [Artomyces pyxidatus]|uniref:Nucleic acid-binding protein n=1 Tax=Artomyces pyxidatus TaxID=48021 RepID=A0ACB8SZ02_9AGAM|nr:nucleic acid-binding protein [Artomyces pyxidatus]
MSAQAATAKLQPPLRDLVTGATQDPAQDFGKSEKDKAEVIEWIDKVARDDFASGEALNTLDEQLVPRTYIVGNYLTAADVALYGALHPTFSQLQQSQYFSHPAVTRYFDHIQSRPSVRKSAEALAPAFSVVPFDFTGAPPAVRKVPEPKKKEKAAKPAEAEASPPVSSSKAKADSSVQSAPVADGEGKAVKKEKKEKKAAAEGGEGKKAAGGGKAPAPAPAEDAAEPIPSMVDLRVGRIIDIKKHPDADGLYVEQIDFGEETGPRTVVSGLVHYIPIEKMRDQWLVGVCNLKPANMRGVKSFAMVLCATSKDGKEAGIELVQPPPDSKPGDRIYFEGAEYEAPLTQLNPKKKIFETIQPGFTTLETKEAAWVNPVTKSVHRIRTKEAVCVAPTLVGASLS